MNCSADGNPAVTCNWSCPPTNCGSLPNTCEINNVKVTGSTTITCTVGNGVCGGGTTSITQHITVVSKTRVPYIVVDGTTTTASTITRNKTESLSLACGIQNQNEMNTKIVWKKDGFVRSIGSLYIPSVASSDDGLYVCETSDAFGNFSTSVSLTVLYPAEQFQITNAIGNQCEWGTVGPQYCNITFSLNPVTHSAILKKNGLIADNDFKYKPQSTNIQNYVFMKNQPTQNDTGSYTLTVTSSTFTPVIFSFTVLVSNPFVVPKDNTATIVGAVLGSIISILLIIIAFLVVKLYRKKKPETSHPRSEGNTNTAADDYVELNQPTNRSHTSQPVVRSQQSTNYENLKNNVNVTRDEQGYADIQGVGPSVATTLNDGYETFIGRKYENTAGQSSSK
uniref:Ig-like domain-containing protein n=1 Tax=Ciona intestinalis TaxID=7719 RepID=H2XMA6_CIOIN